MAKQLERLFVYGTLMPGHGNHRRIAEHVRSTRPATIRGILIDLGAFPALLCGEGRVRGILLEMDAQALTITDQIEGYHPDRHHSLYVRETVEVDFGDGDVLAAWTYYFAKPESTTNSPTCEIAEENGISIYQWSPRR